MLSRSFVRSAALLVTLAAAHAASAQAITFSQFPRVAETPTTNGWDYEDRARFEPPADVCECNSGARPYAVNEQNLTSIGTLTLSGFRSPEDAGRLCGYDTTHRVNRVWVDAMARYDSSDAGRYRLRVTAPGLDTTITSDSFTSDTNCRYRLGADGEITHLLPLNQWYCAIDNMTFRLSRVLDSHNTVLRCKAARVKIEIVPRPQFVGQPIPQVVCENEPALFISRATAYPAPAFQWRRNGVPIPGTTAFYYHLPSASLADAGTIDCVATDGGGFTTTSTPASLTVNPAPRSLASFSLSPSVVCEGYRGQLVLQPSGGAPTDQIVITAFDSDGPEIYRGANTTVTLNAPSDNMTFYAHTENQCGQTTPVEASFTVNPATRIVEQSSALTIACRTDDSSLFVSASGHDPLSFQWFRNGVPISGAIDSTLTRSPLSSDQTGSYFCRVSGPCRSVDSRLMTFRSCPADMNCDGALSPDDLADFITTYFSSNLDPSADFDQDGAKTPDDLADFISTFFAGCD